MLQLDAYRFLPAGGRCRIGPHLFPASFRSRSGSLKNVPLARFQKQPQSGIIEAQPPQQLYVFQKSAAGLLAAGHHGNIPDEIRNRKTALHDLENKIQISARVPDKAQEGVAEIGRKIAVLPKAHVCLPGFPLPLQDAEQPPAQIIHADVLSRLQVPAPLLHIAHFPGRLIRRRPKLMIPPHRLPFQEEYQQCRNQHQKGNERALPKQNQPVKQKAARRRQALLPDHGAIPHHGVRAVEGIVHRMGVLVELPALQDLVVHPQPLF